jgi:hypothetical protein
VTSIAALFEEPEGDEPWFSEPVDTDPRSEFVRQQTFVNYMRKNAPAAMVVAVPNGSNDSDWVKLNKWREGAVAGMTDLAIFWNHGVFLPEFKGGKTTIRPKQRDVLNLLYRMGFRTGVYRQPATLVAHLVDAGCPFFATPPL